MCILCECVFVFVRVFQCMSVCLQNEALTIGLVVTPSHLIEEGNGREGAQNAKVREHERIFDGGRGSACTRGVRYYIWQ